MLARIRCCYGDGVHSTTHTGVGGVGRYTLRNITSKCYPQRDTHEQNTVYGISWHSQLPLRRTRSGPALTVHLREVSTLEGDEVND